MSESNVLDFDFSFSVYNSVRKTTQWQARVTLAGGLNDAFYEVRLTPGVKRLARKERLDGLGAALDLAFFKREIDVSVPLITEHMALRRRAQVTRFNECDMKEL